MIEKKIDKKIEVSKDFPDHQLYGSDLIAEALREQAFPYIVLNPGASYRGLHDSLVNHISNSLRLYLYTKNMPWALPKLRQNYG